MFESFFEKNDFSSLLTRGFDKILEAVVTLVCSGATEATLAGTTASVAVANSAVYILLGSGGATTDACEAIEGADSSSDVEVAIVVVIGVQIRDDRPAQPILASATLAVVVVNTATLCPEASNYCGLRFRSMQSTTRLY